MVFTITIRVAFPAKIATDSAAQAIPKNHHLPDKITAPETSENADNLAGQTAPSKKLTIALAETAVNKYIIICAQGQPVRISSKAASLIVSSDNQDPPNPVWNEKVERWKNILKAKILAPATPDFLDIVDLTNALK